jgi:cytochrome o ubiquinol oxidase subunit I
LIGFYLAFMPLYGLGLLGMTRRLQHYDDPSWHPWLLVAAVGAAVILLGIVFMILQLVVSIRTRDQRRDTTGDPWNGRSLEWSTASPPPSWNFAVLPYVESEDDYWNKKRIWRREKQIETPDYQPIEMPLTGLSQPSSRLRDDTGVRLAGRGRN